MKFKKGKFYRYTWPGAGDGYVVMCTKRSKSPRDIFSGVIILPPSEPTAKQDRVGHTSSRFSKDLFTEVKLDIKIK